MLIIYLIILLILIMVINLKYIFPKSPKNIIINFNYNTFNNNRWIKVININLNLGYIYLIEYINKDIKIYKYKLDQEYIIILINFNLSL